MIQINIAREASRKRREIFFLQSIHPQKSSMGRPVTTRPLHQKTAVSVQPVAARNQLPIKPKPWAGELCDP